MPLGPNGPIAFSGLVGNSRQVFVVNPDGSFLGQVADDPQGAGARGARARRAARRSLPRRDGRMRQSWSAHGFGESRAFADEAEPLLRRCGNLHGIVEMDAGLVSAALDEGEYEAAAEAAEEGLRAAEDASESFALSISLGNVGLGVLFFERMDVADARFREQFEILQRERIDGLWDEPVAGLACVAAAGGDRERAATLIGGHDALPFLPLAGGDLRVREGLLARYLAPARAALGERAWRRAAAAGAAMTLEELFEFALDRRRAAASAPGRRDS